MQVMAPCRGQHTSLLVKDVGAQASTSGRAALSPCGLTFRVMSYNTLADALVRMESVRVAMHLTGSA